MGLSIGFHKPVKIWGYRGYCIPVKPEDGNPRGESIPSQEWALKYHYSKAEIRTLLRHKKIEGFKFRNQLYILDKKPTEDH
jgi:hypothetical protein